MQHKSFDSMPCPIARSLERVGEWWSMLILRDALHGFTRFDQCQKSLGIALLPAELSRRNRGRHTVSAISSDRIRDLLQSLKSNLPVWYAPDQRYSGKNSEIVPFFGQPAASNVATSRLAKISGAPVLPYFPKRRADNRRQTMFLGQPG